MTELGQKLRNAREAKGYSIDDLQKKTKIQKRYLTAIEEGHLDQLPGDFYVRAFVKQYADSVGLNSSEVLAEYGQDIPKVQPEEVPAVPTSLPKEKVSHNFRNHLPQIGILTIVIVIVALVAFVMFQAHQQTANPIPQTNHVGKKATKKTHPNVKRSTKKASHHKSSATSEANQQLKINPVANNANSFEIHNWKNQTQHVVKLSTTTAAAWVTVRGLNNATVWQGTLQPKQEHDVPVDANLTQFQVQTGNAAVTKIKINDVDLPIPTNQTGSVHNYTMLIKEN